MTREEMLALLQEGHVDVERFDVHSPKTLADLLEEINNRDVKLERMRVENGDTRLVLCRTSATVLLRVPSARCLYLETGRMFSTGKWVHEKKEWTISETCKTGEEITDSAIRGLREELGIIAQYDDLRLTWPKGSQEFLLRPSNSYIGLWSATVRWRFLLELCARPWPEWIRRINDYGTLITIERFAY